MSRLIDHVATKRLLLVLDNCEHLLEACAALADVRGSQHIVKDGARRRPPAP